MKISRRAALFGAGVAFVAGVMVSLAIRPPGAGSSPAAHRDGETEVRIHWRMPGAFPSTMPVLGSGIENFTRNLLAASGGAIRLDFFEPGEVVPVFSITDAVRDRKVEAGMTWPGYDQGKIPASALVGATPFGMVPWEYSAWWYHGGGKSLTEDLYAPHNIQPIYCGMIGPETAGWFKQPVTTLDDLEGLKIRFAGLGGQVIERAGASVTMLPGGEIFQALEKGAIDATEFSLPIVDQALGFARIARYNFFPGWHQPHSSMFLMVNRDVWADIAQADRDLIETTCAASVTHWFAESEALQGEVIAGFASQNVTAGSLPDGVLRELQRITDQVLDEHAATDPHFEAILESQRVFHESYLRWRKLAYLPPDF